MECDMNMKYSKNIRMKKNLKKIFLSCMRETGLGRVLGRLHQNQNVRAFKNMECDMNMKYSKNIRMKEKFEKIHSYRNES